MEPSNPFPIEENVAGSPTSLRMGFAEGRPWRSYSTSRLLSPLRSRAVNGAELPAKRSEVSREDGAGRQRAATASVL